MRKISLLFLLLSLAGCGLKLNTSTDGKVLASFDGVQVTDQDFLKKVQTLPQALQKVAFDRKRDFIDDIAAEHFLMKEAQRRGLNKEPEVQDLIQAAQRKIVIAKLVETEIDSKLSIQPEEVSQYYEHHKEEFMTPLTFRASHILVKTEEEALAIKTSLDAGADFGDLARQRSIDATAIRGGDLGAFQKGQFVPEFEEAVLQMKTGQTRGPVQTQFGYHIIRLNDRAEPRLRDFESVKRVVEQRLVNERRAKAFKEYVEKLKGNVKIDVDEQALNQLSQPAAPAR